jgi:CheY-like chemotaxis protein
MSEPAGTVLLVVNDLFFEAKIGEVLRTLGAPFAVAKSADGVSRRLAESAPAVAFVDMGAKGVDGEKTIEAARAAGAPVIAFISHVDVEAGRRARALGATEVMAKSELARRLPELVRTYAGHLVDREKGGGAS